MPKHAIIERPAARRGLAAILAAALTLDLTPATAQTWTGAPAGPGWGAQARPADLAALHKRGEELSAAIFWLDALINPTGDYLLLDEDGGIPQLQGIGVPFIPVGEKVMTQLLVMQVLSGELEPDALPAYIARLRQMTADNRAKARVKKAEMIRLREQNRQQIAAAMRSQTPWAFGLPPQRQQMQSAPAGQPGAFKVFSAVPTQSSDRFRGSTVGELTVNTTAWDRTPYRITGDYVGTVTMPPGGRVLLAGNAAGNAGWGVDNFLYVEIDGRGYVASQDDTVMENGEVLQNLGGDGITDLTAYFQPGVPTTVRIMALDYGGVGGVSDIYLVVR